MSDAIGWSPATTVLSFLLVWPLCGFALSRALRRNDVADLAWGTGIAGLAWMIALPNWLYLGGTQRMLLAFTTLWALRLTLHLAARNLPRSEDPRYVEMRTRWGAHEPREAYLKVFLLQSVLAVVVAMAAWWKLREPFLLVHRPGPLDAVATLLVGTGLVVETLADAMLLRHQARPGSGGGPLRSGPWAWSRHPNYFGETVFWWGVALLGLHRLEDAPALIGAGTITWLLLRVSGVPLLDARMKSRSPEHRAYFEEVSPFVPMPPALWARLSQRK